MARFLIMKEPRHLIRQLKCPSPLKQKGVTYFPYLAIEHYLKLEKPTKYIYLIDDDFFMQPGSDKFKTLIKENLNKINPETGLTDREELTQVFNRGGFSTGHFKPNRNLIFKDKPNNMGFYIGTISHINENKGHLTLMLEDTLSVGDKISINNESYTVSELMIDNRNYETLSKGKRVKIGRMKGKISVGSKVYRIETAKLNKSISPTFKEDKNFKKVKINGLASISEGCPIALKVWSDEGFYKELEYNAIADFIPENAQNKPITVDKIKEQLRMYLAAQEQVKALEQFLLMLKSQAVIEYVDDSYNPVKIEAKMKKASDEIRTKQGKYSAWFMEMLKGMREIKLFVAEKTVLKIFTNKNKKAHTFLFL